MTDLSDDQINAVLLLHPAVSDAELLHRAASELKRRRALENRFSGDTQVASLRAVETYAPTGPRSMAGGPGGTYVTLRDYNRALDELLPYRTELLRLAEDAGAPADPFALWERLHARSEVGHD